MRKDKQRQKLIHSIETMLAGIEMLNFTTLEKVITRSSYCICISLIKKESNINFSFSFLIIYQH